MIFRRASDKADVQDVTASENQNSKMQSPDGLYTSLYGNQPLSYKDHAARYRGTYLPSPSSHGAAPRVRFRSQMMLMVMLVLAFGILVTIVNIYQLHLLQTDPMLRVPPEGRTDSYRRQPVVWINGKKLGSGYLRHVFNVFDRIGYSYVTDEGYDWDVLWAHDYPFVSLKPLMLKLKPHQMVNHFPGSGYLTNKLNLVSSAGASMDFIPKAFRVPKDKQLFMAYANNHPEKMWVQKSSNHRGIKIKSLPELDLDKEGTFIQEFVDEPYLIDERRFDIGVYVTITSINPLRVYVFEGDWLIRFCPEPYYPFDDTVLHKYVVTDDYMPPWKLPSLKRYYEDMEYTRKESIFAHLRTEGHDPEELDRKLKQAIRIAVLDKEPMFTTATSHYPSPRNFFEMVRFDFVLDKKLNVYLMEVNMSPNLSSGHFPPNRLLYEQVIYSMLSLVGVAHNTDMDFVRGTVDEREMQVSSRDILTYYDLCASDICQDNCRSMECKMCHECLKAEQVATLEKAYLEHIHRQTWRRVVPRPFASPEAAKIWSFNTDTAFKNLTMPNQQMAVWFRGKCLQDPTWCS